MREKSKENREVPAIFKEVRSFFMKISFLVIASEVLEGKVQDINTLELSQFLRAQNFSLWQVITIPDDKDQIISSLKLLQKSDLVLVSGGLGPTPDDLTKTCLARFLNVPLASTAESQAIARQNFENRGLSFPADHPYQMIPEGTKPLFNPEGLAPGFQVTSGKSTFIFLPGVPREFKAMMKLHLPPSLPRFQEHLSDIIVRTKGIAEEKIFTELDNKLWDKLSQLGTVASLPYLSGVDITLRVRASSMEEMALKKEAIIQFLSTHPLQQYIWHVGSETLEECIINKAKSLGLQFGFAESCTGGLCSDKITNVNGSSNVFYGSVICYNTQVKTKLLKVNPQIIEDTDVVSEAVAREMAQGLRQLFPVDIAVSITGYAGPHPKEALIPIGTVCIGVSSPLGISSQQYQFSGDRLRLKNSFYQASLFQLLETLEKLALVDMSS